MKVSKMIATIQLVEKNQWDASRIRYFQKQNLCETQGVIYDTAFGDFIKDLERVIGTVRIPTAKKILNNWYLWAKNSAEDGYSV